MEAPHILDTAGREAFRLELLKEVRRRGGKAEDKESIESLREKLVHYEVTGKFPEPPRREEETETAAASEPVGVPRGINSGKIKTTKRKKAEEK